jgi:hypothetical protein
MVMQSMLTIYVLESIFIGILVAIYNNSAYINRLLIYNHSVHIGEMVTHHLWTDRHGASRNYFRNAHETCMREH